MPLPLSGGSTSNENAGDVRLSSSWGMVMILYREMMRLVRDQEVASRSVDNPDFKAKIDAAKSHYDDERADDAVDEPE